MPGLYNFSETEMLAFFMVLLRMSAFAVTWPIFGAESVPAMAKVLLALVLTILVFPTIKWNHLTADLDSLQVIWIAMREVFIGLSLGALARLFFYVINICGELVSVSMGLSSGALFNPLLGSTSTAVEQLQVMLATLYFLAFNGHHVLLSALVDSFGYVPLSHEAISVVGLGSMGTVLQSVVEMGLKLSAPVMISVLGMNVTMGVIGRAVPQINVLITSLPVNIMLGLFVLTFSLPLMVTSLRDVFQHTTDSLFEILKTY